MDQNIYDRIGTLLTTRFGVQQHELSPEVTLENLRFDSLALLEFALAIEESFGTPIDAEELSPVHTLESTVELVAAKGVTV